MSKPRNRGPSDGGGMSGDGKRGRTLNREGLRLYASAHPCEGARNEMHSRRHVKRRDHRNMRKAMTLYVCDECGETHDSREPRCPQTFDANTNTAESDAYGLQLANEQYDDFLATSNREVDALRARHRKELVALMERNHAIWEMLDALVRDYAALVRADTEAVRQEWLKEIDKRRKKLFSLDGWAEYAGDTGEGE